VLNRTYEDQECSIARALEVIGERWTMLIVRDVFVGINRFDDLQRSLGIARNILQARLEWLCEEGVLERRPYQQRRYEYHLTKKGRDLWPAMMTLLSWGDRYYAPEGKPRIFKHRDCGGRLDDRLNCRKCGASLTARDVYWEWGPGASDLTREVRGELEHQRS
jgi:DNA-binding HxlR family transcriptional regulator